MTISNNCVAELEVKNKNLEKQVQDLIEACGKGNSDGGRVSFESSLNNPNLIPNASISQNGQNIKSQIKCKFNDKGLCQFGAANCRNLHSKVVCQSFSKWGFCENEATCADRHPRGICNEWKRGVCSKTNECYFRHPEDEYGSQKQNDDVSFHHKRKRTMSQQFSPKTPKSPRTENKSQSQNESFLYRKVMELKSN